MNKDKSNKVHAFCIYLNLFIFVYVSKELRMVVGSELQGEQEWDFSGLTV